MKSNQVQTRMAKEDIEIIAKLAREAHMTPAAMVRRLVLERLEQLAPLSTPQEPSAKSPPQEEGVDNED